MIFSKAISRRVIKIPVYNGGVLNRHRPRAAGYLNAGFTYQQMRYSKSLWRNGYYFINGYDLFYNERNSPESLQAYNPALGGYIIQVEITSNMQVPCHCQHAPWHLGANAKSFFAQLIEDPTHHILNEPALGGYQLLLSKIQGTQASVHYIERSTTQLVEYKALNLMDVGSSPMVEITSHDVIINE